MSLLKLLLSGSLTFIVMTSFTTGEFADDLNVLKYGLSHDIDPSRCTVTLDLETDFKKYSGMYICEIRIHRNVQVMKLHTKGLVISEAILTNQNKTYTLSTVRIGQNILTLTFTEVLLHGDYELTVKYTGYIKDYSNGMIKTSYINVKGGEEQIVISRINAIQPQRLFPCWNDPAFKATYDIAITYFGNMTALSNTQMKDLLFLKENTWIRFKTSRVIPSYLVGFVIAPFLNVFVRGMSIRCRQKAAIYLQFADIIIKNLTVEFLLEWENLKRYALPRMNYVAIPAYPENMLTTLELILYREADIMYDENIHSSMHQMNVAYLIARGVAHQYFVTLVSPSWWSYLWLNEAITTLLAIDAVDKNYNMRMKDMFTVQMQYECFQLDIINLMEPLIFQKNRDPFQPIRSFSYYFKAPLILRMLQYILTDKIFRKGIDMYILNNIFDAASLEDFWAAMQTVYDEFNNSTLKIADVMYTWTACQNYPILYVTRVNSSYVQILVENMRMLDLEQWFVPLTLTRERFPLFHYENVTWLETIPGHKFLIYYPLEEIEGWVIINLQQVGYYRVNYEPENWYKIAMYLDSWKYTDIHVVNRAQIVNDAFYFLIMKKFDLNLFFQIVQFLSREIDFIAWYPMFKALEYMSCFFPYPESTFIKLKLASMVKEASFKNRNRTNTKIDSKLSTSFTTEIARWECFFDLEPCITETRDIFEKDLEQKQNFSLKGKEWIYSVGSRKVNRYNWNKMLEMYLHKHNDEIFKYLAFCEDPKIIIDYMNVLVSIEYAHMITRYERVSAFHSIITRHIRNDVVFDYVLANFGKLRPRDISVFVTLNFMINNLYSTEQLNKLRTYVENNIHSNAELYTTLIIKHQYFNKPFYILKDRKDCESIVEKCVLAHTGKLIFAIKIKIQMRLNDIELLKQKFKKLSE